MQMCHSLMQQQINDFMRQCLWTMSWWPSKSFAQSWPAVMSPPGISWWSQCWLWWHWWLMVCQVCPVQSRGCKPVVLSYIISSPGSHGPPSQHALSTLSAHAIPKTWLFIGCPRNIVSVAEPKTNVYFCRVDVNRAHIWHFIGGHLSWPRGPGAMSWHLLCFVTPSRAAWRDLGLLVSVPITQQRSWHLVPSLMDHLVSWYLDSWVLYIRHEASAGGVILSLHSGSASRVIQNIFTIGHSRVS